MTADELGITQEELDSLLRVREMLSTGCLVHVNEWTDDVLKQNPMAFNMALGGAKTECGTVGCIGGWMALDMLRQRGGGEALTDDDVASVMDDYVSEAVDSDSSLRQLFYPDGVSWPDISTEEAVTAITNYVTVGMPRWREISQGQD